MTNNKNGNVSVKCLVVFCVLVTSDQLMSVDEDQSIRDYRAVSEAMCG